MISRVDCQCCARAANGLLHVWEILKGSYTESGDGETSRDSSLRGRGGSQRGRGGSQRGTRGLLLVASGPVLYSVVLYSVDSALQLYMHPDGAMAVCLLGEDPCTREHVL